MDKESKYLTAALLIAIAILIALFAYGNSEGCDKAALRQASQEAVAEADAATMSEWRKILGHNTMYADEHHLWFSWYGYKNPTVEDLFRSYSGWWGCPVPIVLERFNDVFFIIDLK